MLTTLHIENVAVVRCADIELNTGLTVLTGETGAGKSILIDSINLLLGSKAERDLVRTGEKSALVSAVFCDLPSDIVRQLAELGVECDEDGCLIISRSLTAEGRASTRINNRPVTVSLQKEIGHMLVSIHGQHDNTLLMDVTRHLSLLDTFADDGEQLASYAAAYDEMQHFRRRIDALQKDAQDKARLSEVLQYQINDIESAKLKEGEEEELTARRDRIRNLEQISKQVRIVYRSLYRSEKGFSASEQLERAANALENLSAMLPQASEFSEKLNAFRYELEDIALTANSLTDTDYDDPDAELDRIEGRLEQITKLKRKYGSDIPAILAFLENAKKKYQDIEQSDELLDELARSLDKAEKQAEKQAVVLTEKRKAAAQILESAVMKELSFLELGKVRFSVAVRHRSGSTEDRLTRSGADEVEFLIATNPGEPLKPLIKIASGGELSRIMLALKSVLADRDGIGTIIYDEIDTGISGKTSQKIGIKLRETAKNCQVLCVTHSAQIAALGNQHLEIRKTEEDGRAVTNVTPLEGEARVREVARIMGGSEITQPLLESAKELIAAGDHI